jgi:hypothetical protein
MTTAMQDAMTEMFGEPVFTYTEDQAIADGVLTEFPHAPQFLFAAHAANKVGEMATERGVTVAQVMGPIVIDAQAAWQEYYDRTNDTLLSSGAFVDESGFWVSTNGRRGLTIMLPADY